MRTFFPVRMPLRWALALLVAMPTAQGRALPPGFEDLASGHAEQVEVRAFGRSAGLWRAWVTLDHVRLEQPAQVLAALGLADAAQQALAPSLATALPRDSHLACLHAQPQPGCGWRAPAQDPAAVTAIFDEAEGVLMLFPSLQWIPDAAQRARFHDVAEHAHNALLHQQVLHLSGGDGEYALNAHGRGALGVGRAGHVGGSWNHARWQSVGGRTHARTTVDELYYRHDVGPQHYLQAGRMDRRNLSSPLGGQFGLELLPLGRLDGVRVGTTQAYVDVEALDQALPVSVLLGRDARVDVFDGERLLQTFYLPAGVTVLDTRLFPAGSYLLTLRIHEDGRFVRSETVPFQRSVHSSPQGLQWFVQGGRHHEAGLRGRDTSGALQAGLRLPVSAGSSLGVGVAQLQGTGFGELRAGLRGVLGAYDLHADLGVLAATDGARGGQLQLSLRHVAAWNLYRQQLRGGRCRRAERQGEARLGCADATSASVSAPLFGGSVHLGHTRRRSLWMTGTGTDDAFGLPLPPPSTATTRTLQASFTRTQPWRGLSIGTRLAAWQQRSGQGAYAPRDRGVQVSVNVTRLLRGDRQVRLQRAGIEAGQRAGQALDPQLRLGQSWRQEHDTGARELAAELGAQPDGHTDAFATARLQGAWGQAGATLAHARAPSGARTSWSAHHSAGLAVSPEGVFWGGADGADAGVAVAIARDPDRGLHGPAAEVQAGASRRQTLRFGERRLLPVSGYQRHRVHVQDVSAHAPLAAVRVHAAGTRTQPFLSPGRLMVVPIAVAASHAYLGSAFDEAGAPLSGARILNAAVPAVEEGGGFLAEFEQRQPWLYLLHGERLLRCPLQVRGRRSVLLQVGRLACTPLSSAQLPAAITEQPRVQRLLRAVVPAVAGNGSASP